MDRPPVQLASISPAIDAQYGPIQPSEEYLLQLRDLVHSHGTLQKAGYSLRQFSGSELNKKRRCQQCSRTLPASFKKHGGLPKAAVTVSNHGGKGATSDTNSKDASSDKSKKPNLRCKFHPGRVAQRKWTCCHGNISSPPCEGEEEHMPRIYGAGELAKDWRFHITPPPNPKTTPALAVVIDCEMGVALSGESELIRVSVVDYFSRAILLDSLVCPDVKMARYNTRFSGVTAQAMDNARRRRTGIFGRADARKALWKFIGPETIVIGHAGHGDLTSLRWIHPVVIDTLIIETRNRPPQEKEKEKEKEKEREEEKDKDKETEKTEMTGNDPQTGDSGEGSREESREKPKERERGGLSLKALALQRLNRTIQIKGRGHDSLEDAIATRDVLHWNVTKMVEEESVFQLETATG